jgi:diaminopimelate decarboxylase
MKYINKNLAIEKVNVQKIAKKFGTPTYCYSHKQLTENIKNFKKNFSSFSPLICFAVKSNTNVNLIREIRKLGLGADVVSMGELKMALKAGINPKKIVFSGVGKTSTEISYAIDKKILLINAESKSEIIEIEKIAKKFGTPTYCYSHKQLTENIKNFKKSFSSFSPLICFAVKSNANVNLLREIRKLGLGADVVSMGELMIALKAGIEPKKLFFQG